MYVYYQVNGGVEEWQACQFKHLGSINPRPTFITILSLDVLVTPDMSRETRDKIRYQGPMYFDLDSEDVGDSLNDARELVDRLVEQGLTEGDMSVYLSGKKGVHLVIPQEVFMERPSPLQRLPAIYKELAFHFAVGTTDFAVYTASRGRMFRTPYNQRENGNYKVRITLDELKKCHTQADYNALCQAPRNDVAPSGTFRPRFALLFDAARQKITKVKVRKPKPVSAKQLAEHEPIVAKILAGRVEDGVGFNKVAIQLALYARTVGMSPQKLVEEAATLVASHSGDGIRYNTPDKRARELVRMCQYVEDNPAYEYAIEPIKAMVKRQTLAERAESGNNVTHDEGDESDVSGGVFIRSGTYWVRGADEDSEKCILAGQFVNCRVLSNANTGAISCLVASFSAGGVIRDVSIERADFTGSAVLHRLTSQFGVSFMGSDINARGIYELMLRNVAPHRYVTEREGLDVVSIPTSPFEEAQKPFVIWADYRGVRVPKHIADLGVNFQFQGYPDPGGVVKTDLSNSPTLGGWIAEGDNKEQLKQALLDLITCHTSDVSGKMIGWMVACFWRQLFHEAYGKFPLLHVNGPAGSGKTEYTSSLLHFFYWNATPRETTPSSSTFAMLSLFGGSASVPILVDEYKPQEMAKEKHNQLKLLLRDSYNRRETTRGGGNRSKDNFGALSIVTLAAPVVFVAEAIEEETALLERTVLVTMKRQPQAIASRNYLRFQSFKRNKRMLALLGANIAAHIVSTGSIEKLMEEFDIVYEQGRMDHLLQPGDKERLSAEELARKSAGKERLVYNHAVAMFGLNKFSDMLRAIFKEEYATTFKAHIDAMKSNVYTHMSDVAINTLPEYLKVLMVMSDMSRLDPHNPHALLEGREYNLSEEGGLTTIHIVLSAAYAKYRAWMRQQGSSPLYLNDAAFLHSLKDSPQYLRRGANTKMLIAPTVILDYAALQVAGIPLFLGKVVSL